MNLKDYITEQKTKEEDIKSLESFAYLQEDEQTYFLKVWPTIEKECAPYIRDLKKMKKPRIMLRGSPSIGRYGGTKKVRKDRRPSDTEPTVHYIFDRFFLENFGWRARSEGLFVYPASKDAIGYGPVHMTFPIGKYDIVWSETVRDLYSSVKRWHIWGNIQNDEDLYQELFDHVEADNKHLFDPKRSDFKNYSEDDLDKYKKNFVDDHGQFRLFKSPDQLKDWEKDLVYKAAVDLKDMKSYKSGNLEAALKSKHEIMVKTNKAHYLSFHMYRDLIAEILWGKGLTYKE